MLNFNYSLSQHIKLKTWVLQKAYGIHLLHQKTHVFSLCALCTARIPSLWKRTLWDILLDFFKKFIYLFSTNTVALSVYFELEIDLQPFNNQGGLTYRTIGGILDFFIFLGPTPDDVVSQYVNIIGLPFMPPLWTLGFHLCRHEYGNSSAFKNVIARNRAANIPYVSALYCVWKLFLRKMCVNKLVIEWKAKNLLA